MVTETIAEATNTDQPLYIAFLDLSETCDMVEPKILLNALHDLEIEPHVWKLYQDMLLYSSLISSKSK